MQAIDDLALLREYAAKKSEAAFETLVSRYINVVYSAALRQAGDPHLAQEVTQAVFIILARKAGGMGEGTLLLGWLVRTVRFTASAQIRTTARRRRREQEAHMDYPTVETSPDATWERMSPLLDEALASLNAPDRQAVLLRFFEDKSLAEVSASLAVNEDAARKRVARALEKLRQFFTKRGVVLTAAVIGGAISANAAPAAPAGLAKAVAVTAVAHTAAGGSTLTLVKGALKLMAWAKAKMAVVAGVGVLLAAGTTTVVVKYEVARKEALIYEPIFEHIYETNGNKYLEAAPPILILRPTHYPDRHNAGRWPPGGKGVCVNLDLYNFIQEAFNDMGEGVPSVRMIFEEGTGASKATYYDTNADTFLELQKVGYGAVDYLVTLPDHQREALRAELKRQFGLDVRYEMRAADVLRLQVKDMAKFKAHVSKGGTPSAGWISDKTVRGLAFTNDPVSVVARWLEGGLGKPVVDATESLDHYDFTVEWPEEQTFNMSVRRESVQQVLDKEFGLELVPSRESVEMLVVERVNN